MEKVIKFFHYLSFVKYPILVIGLYFVYQPLLSEHSNLLDSYNNGLILLGLGIGLDSLKDYKKLTWLDKKVYHKPHVAKYYFCALGAIILTFIALGIYGYFSTDQNALKELSIGFVIFGIGAIGILKSGIGATKQYMERST